MERKWWHNAVVYQVYPRSFNDTNKDGIGDLKGITEKLDYIKKLGANVIWLSPVYKSPMDDNGYDISDYQDIAEEFGTLEDMEELIAQGEKRGIKIIMDLVVNHTSDEHPWFLEARKSKDNPYRDYYVWRDPKEDGSVPNGLTSCFSGSAWEMSEETGQYFLHLFSKRQPDLNWENGKVIEEVHNMMNWWLDKGIGGFRMDVIDLIGKEVDKEVTGNGPRLHPLLKAMNKATFGDRDVLTVGETWGATPEIAKMYSDPKRDELSMVFQFEHISAFSHETLGKWKGKPMDFKVIKEIFTKWQTELKEDGWNSLFWNNHDLPRMVSKFGNDKKYRKESAKMLATMIHMMKGTPYIYQGEELGMTNVKFETLEEYKDIETLNAYKEHVGVNLTHDEMMDGIWRNGRDNARTPMHWSMDKHAGFTEGEPWIKVNPNYTSINAEESLADEDSIFNYYKKLIQLRKEIDTIVYGDFKLCCKEDDRLFVYKRELEDDQLLVILNLTEDQVDFRMPEELKKENWDLVISNYETGKGEESELTLQPYEAVVYRNKK